MFCHIKLFLRGKMENALISVVVPVYNVEKYVKKCLDSLIAQTYKTIEIIVVDDGSTDSSLSICTKLSLIDSRIVVFHKENGGLSDARNYGIKRAKGSYVTFVDSDDFVDSNMIEELFCNAAVNNCEISICGKTVEYENGGSTTKCKGNELKVFTDKESSLIALNSYGLFNMSAWGKLYSIKLFTDIEFPVGKKCEDFYVMHLLFSKANGIVFFDKPLYHYLQRSGSISHNAIIDYSYLDASKEQMEFINIHYPHINYVGITAFVFANIGVINNYSRLKIKCSKQEKRELKITVKRNLKYVLRNKYIPVYKKIQAIAFAVSVNLYICVLKIVGKQ